MYILSVIIVIMGFVSCVEFSQLKKHYHSILHLMPEDYEQTLGRLQNFINDDQMCAILCCSSPPVANKMILDCLVDRMQCEEDLFDFCDQLEMVTGSQDLNIIISDIRSGKFTFPSLNSLAV